MASCSTISIPTELQVVFGKPLGKNSTIYEQEGDFAHAQSWFRAARKVVGEIIALPSVSLLVPVSRNAIHKRIKEGKLTCFRFSVTDTNGKQPVSKSLKRERPHSFVPVLECKLWFQEIHDRLCASDGSVAVDYMVLDEERYFYSHFDFHARPFIGHGEKEYERLIADYFENRKAKYGW